WCVPRDCEPVTTALPGLPRLRDWKPPQSVRTCRVACVAIPTTDAVDIPGSHVSVRIRVGKLRCNWRDLRPRSKAPSNSISDQAYEACNFQSRSHRSNRSSIWRCRIAESNRPQELPPATADDSRVGQFE